MNFLNSRIRECLLIQSYIILSILIITIITHYGEYLNYAYKEASSFKNEINLIKDTLNIISLEIDRNSKGKLDDKILYLSLDKYEQVFSVQRKFSNNKIYNLFFVKKNTEKLEAFPNSTSNLIEDEINKILDNNVNWGIYPKGDSIYFFKNVSSKWGGFIRAIFIKLSCPKEMDLPYKYGVLDDKLLENNSSLYPVSLSKFFLVKKQGMLFRFLFLYLGFLIISFPLYIYINRKSKRTVNYYINIVENLNSEISVNADSYYTLMQIERNHRSKIRNYFMQEIKLFPLSKEIFERIRPEHSSYELPQVTEPSVLDIYNGKLESLFNLVGEVKELLEWQIIIKKIDINIVLQSMDSYLYEGSYKYLQAIFYVLIDTLLKDLECAARIEVSLAKRDSIMSVCLKGHGDRKSDTPITHFKDNLKKIDITVYEQCTKNQRVIKLIFPYENIDNNLNDDSNSGSNIYTFPKNI